MDSPTAINISEPTIKTAKRRSIMKQLDLLGIKGKITITDNVLMVTSQTDLTIVSSAFYNGGVTKTKTILNIQVSEDNQIELHNDPLIPIKHAKQQLQLNDDFVAMLTIVDINKMAFVSARVGEVSVNVVVTGGCTHPESAGEKIDSTVTAGTINTIVLVDGNPSGGALMNLFLTATEAKVAAVQDLDVRSRYTGVAATGTVTDSLVIAVSGKGERFDFGSPASSVGQLVAQCVRKTVRQAISNYEGEKYGGTIATRLKDRQLTTERFTDEIAKVKGLGIKKNDLAAEIETILKDEHLAVYLLAAAKLDEDFQKQLIKPQLSFAFGILNPSGPQNVKSDAANLPPFTKQALLNILANRKK